MPKNIKKICTKCLDMYKVKTTSRYKKDLKYIQDNRELIYEIDTIVTLLAEDDAPLPEKYKDHSLKGQYAEFRECHIRPNWLLVYQKTKKDLILLLIATGTHSYIS